MEIEPGEQPEEELAWTNESAKPPRMKYMKGLAMRLLSRCRLFTDGRCDDMTVLMGHNSCCRTEEFTHPAQYLDPGFSLEEATGDIKGMRNRKVVPSDSPVTEIWKSCPQAFAGYFPRMFRECRRRQSPPPAKMIDCTLALFVMPQ